MIYVFILCVFMFYKFLASIREKRSHTLSSINRNSVLNVIWKKCYVAVFFCDGVSAAADIAQLFFVNSVSLSLHISIHPEY